MRFDKAKENKKISEDLQHIAGSLDIWEKENSISAKIRAKVLKHFVAMPSLQQNNKRLVSLAGKILCNERREEQLNAYFVAGNCFGMKKADTKAKLEIEKENVGQKATPYAKETFTFNQPTKKRN